MTDFKYPHNDKIKAILDDTTALVEGYGLNYLIPRWQQFADQYADTEKFIYEWLDDLDTRRIIDQILSVLTDDERIAIEPELTKIDSKVKEKTFEINECVRGDEVEKNKQYDRQKNWYYYRLNQHVFDAESGQFTKRQ